MLHDKSEAREISLLVLLVEDNPDIVANVADYLAECGHQVDFAGSGRQALYLLEQQSYDAMVLDLGLPDLDGLEVCRRARLGQRNAALPVLMLTARDRLEQRLEGFAAGTDDYLVKPFALSELAARLDALARRRGGQTSGAQLRAGELVYDTDTLRVTRAGRELQLPPAPRQLLEHLLRNQHRVVPREELQRLLWGDEPPDSDALRSHLHKLRSIIDRPFDRPLLHTVPRLGYRIHAGD